jgi:hypothetical protein
MKTTTEPILNPSRLKKGIKLVLKTNTKTFSFYMLEGGKASVQSNGKPFKTKTPCQLVGSLSSDGTLFADKICKETRVIMSIPTGRHITGVIKSATICGVGWDYSLWEN